jgi:hypothetical protein
MPLSPPSDRVEKHARHIACRGYRRADGKWDIEAEMADVKTHPMPNVERGAIPAGHPIHTMWVRLTIDEGYLIHKAEVAIDNAPFAVCRGEVPPFERLEGLTIGPGFLKEVRALFGGTRGCTHILDLMSPLAVVAWQTILPFAMESGDEDGSRAFDTCHALATDGALVTRHWPDHAAGKTPPASERAPTPER